MRTQLLIPEAFGFFCWSKDGGEKEEEGGEEEEEEGSVVADVNSNVVLFSFIFSLFSSLPLSPPGLGMTIR